jgi:hypothetical protein
LDYQLLPRLDYQLLPRLDYQRPRPRLLGSKKCLRRQKWV